MDSAGTPQPVGFLSLPLELRQMIYREYIIDKVLPIRRYQVPTPNVQALLQAMIHVQTATRQPPSVIWHWRKELRRDPSALSWAGLNEWGSQNKHVFLYVSRSLVPEYVDVVKWLAPVQLEFDHSYLDLDMTFDRIFTSSDGKSREYSDQAHVDMSKC